MTRAEHGAALQDGGYYQSLFHETRSREFLSHSWFLKKLVICYRCYGVCSGYSWENMPTLQICGGKK